MSTIDGNPSAHAERPISRNPHRGEMGRRPPQSSEKDFRTITFSPSYVSAVNSITRPDRFVFVTRYLVEKWLPDLGPNGFAILAFFRRECYHNRETGELRNRREIALPEIAQGCHLSVSTIRRELQKNTALQKFIFVQPEYAYDDQRGGYRKGKSSYVVLMDDPVHESDQELLQERVREIAALREKSGDDLKIDALERSRSALRQNDLSQTVVSTSIPSPPLKMQRGGCQNDTPPLQNDVTLKESFENTKSQEITLNVERDVNFVAQKEKTSTNSLDAEVNAIVEELHDYGSERRHRQLLSICYQHNAMEASTEAMRLVRVRLADESRLGPIKQPGRYYDTMIRRLLEERGIRIPRKGGAAETQKEVRSALGLSDHSPPFAVAPAFLEELDVLDSLSPEEFAALEAVARAQVIESSVDPVRKLARQGKAWTSVKPMMRKILSDEANQTHRQTERENT